ncbi:hypothetical protein ES705_30323 [subsurface metagenome]
MGNPDEFTILELSEKVIDITGGRSKIIHKPLLSDDPRQRKPDITLAKQELGWEPKIKLGGTMATGLKSRAHIHLKAGVF